MFPDGEGEGRWPHPLSQLSQKRFETMITGKLIQNGKSKSFTAEIHAMTFDLVGLNIVPNSYKTKDNHPDYHVEAKTPRGRILRIGSMWKAVSEKSGNAYFSISLTDRMRREWRMNAVRNEEMAKGEWQVVPLAGGKTDQIMLNGKIELLEDDAMVGSIGSYDFDIDFVGVPNVYKASDDHPDYHIVVKSPAGVEIRMGSIWKSISDSTGNAYLSLSFYSPFGSQHRANGLRRDEEPEGQYEIVPLSSPKAMAA